MTKEKAGAGASGADNGKDHGTGCLVCKAESEGAPLQARTDSETGMVPIEPPLIEGDLSGTSVHEGHYYVAPGKTLTLVDLEGAGFYLWFSGVDVNGYAKRYPDLLGGHSVTRNKLSRKGELVKFTSWDKGTGGYLFVSGKHLALQVLKGSIQVVKPSKPGKMGSFTGDLELHVSPGTVTIDDSGEAVMYDSWGRYNLSIGKGKSLRTYGAVGGEVVLNDEGARASLRRPCDIRQGANGAVDAAKEGKSINVTVTIPDGFTNRELADAVLEGITNLGRELQKVFPADDGEYSGPGA